MKIDRQELRDLGFYRSAAQMRDGWVTTSEEYTLGGNNFITVRYSPYGDMVFVGSVLGVDQWTRAESLPCPGCETIDDLKSLIKIFRPS